MTNSPISWARRHGTLITMIALTIIGGGNPVAVRISNRELAPFWGAGTRFIAAALLLWAIVLSRRVELPRGRTLARVLTFGSIQYGVGIALMYWGLVSVPAGLGQTILAIVPLSTLLLAVAVGQERLHWSGVTGAFMALLGISVMAGGPSASNLPLIAVLSIVGSAVLIAIATVLARGLADQNPLIVNAVGMGAGGALLLTASTLFGEEQALPTSLDATLAIAYLVVFGSLLVFTFYLYVLKAWSASVASYAFVIYPIWAVLFSTQLDGEQISATYILGAVLTLSGVWLSIAKIGRSQRAVPSQKQP